MLHHEGRVALVQIHLVHGAEIAHSNVNGARELTIQVSTLTSSPPVSNALVIGHSKLPHRLAGQYHHQRFSGVLRKTESATDPGRSSRCHPRSPWRSDAPTQTSVARKMVQLKYLYFSVQTVLMDPEVVVVSVSRVSSAAICRSVPGYSACWWSRSCINASGFSFVNTIYAECWRFTISIYDGLRTSPWRCGRIDLCARRVGRKALDLSFVSSGRRSWGDGTRYTISASSRLRDKITLQILWRKYKISFALTTNTGTRRGQPCAGRRNRKRTVRSGRRVACVVTMQVGASPRAISSISREGSLSPSCDLLSY